MMSPGTKGEGWSLNSAALRVWRLPMFAPAGDALETGCQLVSRIALLRAAAHSDSKDRRRTWEFMAQGLR